MKNKHYKMKLSRAAMTLLLLLATSITVQAVSDKEIVAYRSHRPIGHIESIEAKHGSLIVKGWGLDLDGYHSTNVSIILKQNGTKKYEFVSETTEFRYSFSGNAFFRGYHGFTLKGERVKPGDYQLSGIVRNSGQPHRDMPMTFEMDGVDPYTVDLIQVTTIEKPITILPYVEQVTFDCNYEGGTNPDPLLICDDAWTYLPTNNVSRPGYTFVCWTPSSVRGESVTAKAHWLPGTGTKEDPWRITCQEDWDSFVLMCSESTDVTHPSKSSKVPHPVPDPNSHVRLEMDVTMGSKGILGKFMGEFDGNGHTITLNNPYSAPFWAAHDCYIHNLTVRHHGWACLSIFTKRRRIPE